MENNNHERDAEPIEAHLEAVATKHAVPIDAVGVCIRRIEDAAPALRTVIERAAAGEEVSFEASTLLLRGLFILAGTRDSASFQPFLRLLRLPQDELEALVGDLITDGTAKIAASLFDGDVEGLLACIADRGMNEFSRDALLRAATFLTFDGQIDRDRFRRFLVAFHEDTLADDEDFVWAGWVTAIGRLGFRDLAPLVKQAWSEGKMPDRVMEWRHFEQELRDAERAPDDPERFRGSEYGYIDDVLKEMAWTTIEEAPPASSGRQSGRGYVPDMPIINPNRGVGRNDPCPCGSGKKYKKCCLGG